MQKYEILMNEQQAVTYHVQANNAAEARQIAEGSIEGEREIILSEPLDCTFIEIKEIYL